MKSNVSDLSGQTEQTIELPKSDHTYGFTSTFLEEGIQQIKKMKKIVLCYTSNIISSGLRELILEIVKNNQVNAILTTAGGIEEDLIKEYSSYFLTNFDTDGASLRTNGYNRIGNLAVCNDSYVKLEQIISKQLDLAIENKTKCLKKNEECSVILNVSEFIKCISSYSKHSILGYSNLNNISVFCSSITDGSIGDILTFYHQNEKIKINIMDEYGIFGKEVEGYSAIIIGDGAIKNKIVNAGITDIVQITTREKYDMSDLVIENIGTRIIGDATIIFPIIYEKCFK